MGSTLVRGLVGMTLLGGAGTMPARAQDVRLLGTGAIPGNAIDYLATPDRGPADGTTTYTDRAYLLRIDVRRSPVDPTRFVVTPRVVTTVLLASERGRRFTGSAAAFDPTNSPASPRLDPEGIRAAACGGRFYVSDEYGPFLYEFDFNGRRRRALDLPNKFLVDLPSATWALATTKTRSPPKRGPPSVPT